MTKHEVIGETLRKGLGQLSHTGALVVETGQFTGRATQQKFLVRDSQTENTIDWGKVNQPIDPDRADAMWKQLEKKFSSRKTYSYRGYIGPFTIRVDSLSPWHIAFAQNMFRRDPAPVPSKSPLEQTEFRVLHDPEGRVSELGVPFPHEAAIILDAPRGRILIVGTGYAGEIKKAAFTLCNYLMPEIGIFPMHASANCLIDGSETCVLFGLSGTGKTTLSASHDRCLIGDDEILWSRSGVSNLEGGCYAKLIDLDETREPQIFGAVNRPGSIMENVVIDPGTGRVDFNSREKTENTRGSYPLDALECIYRQDIEAAPPKTIIFLTADAFGALPAVARLDEWQAQYHFISGYTAKVAGTELGVKHPEAAFSACFGAPFMPRPVSVYAHLFSEFCRRAGASVWMLNTGWTGGPYGKGERFPIPVSRRLLSAIQSGELAGAPMRRHPVFGFEVPQACAGVDPRMLTIPSGPEVMELARRFDQNFAQSSARDRTEIRRLGGPRLPRGGDRLLAKSA